LRNLVEVSVRKNFIFGLVLLVSMLACRFSAEQPTPMPTPSATETPAPTLTPEPTATLIPAPTATEPLRATGGPALRTIHMLSQLNGWGIIDSALLITHDGGITWASVPLPNAQMTAGSDVVFISPEIIYVLVPGSEGRNAQFFTTRDSGITWETNPLPFPQAELDFLNDNIGFAYQVLSTDAGNMSVTVYQTLDRGLSWLPVFSHQTSQTTENLPLAGEKTGITFIDPSLGWMGMANIENEIGLYRSSDAGRTWIKQQMTAPASLGAFTATTHPPFIFRDNSVDAILAVDFATPGLEESTRVFYMTHDTGATWAEAGAIPTGAAFTFINPQTGWAWGGHNLYFTADAAQTWTLLPVAFSKNERASCLNFINEKNGWLITVDQKNRVHLYRSYDGGNTWTAITP
jgi:photosystem II stability/assembly factor-like uncharacterized protein